MHWDPVRVAWVVTAAAAGGLALAMLLGDEREKRANALADASDAAA